MEALAGKARADLGDVNKIGKGHRPAGYVKQPIMQYLKD